MKEDRAWVADALHIIEADFNRSADTHLLRVPLPGAPDVALYLKDESTHPSGSLKHRLARSLFLYGLCNGWIGPDHRSSRLRADPLRSRKPTSPACWACASSP